jgi:NADH-quinone oxidoreductase subunit F
MFNDKVKSVEDLNDIAQAYEFEKQGKKQVFVCAGTGCVANGSMKVLKAFQEEIKKRGVDIESGILDELEINKSGCQGFCQAGPLVLIEPEGRVLIKVKKEDVPEIVDHILTGGQAAEPEGNIYHEDGQVLMHAKDIPFYKHQQKVVLTNCGKIDPEDIRAYIARGGYLSLAKVLSLKPEEVCQTVLDSGLRGRGGGGFSTGLKWQLTRKSVGEKKYVICNGDEGDPGAFMDCGLMEGDPHRVIEGMLIAAYAIGADEGVFYVRAEYPLAIKRLTWAIESAEKLGLIGDNIFGSDFSCSIRIYKGAGAFVCGEETALLASIEGKRGMPRPKPPFPADKGLFGRPTVINNVETLANIPGIIQMGSENYRVYGTAKSPGTKTFSLTGEVKNTGLIEVPLGTTLKEVVFEIGGGMRDGQTFKAVQIGGPSGGCLTEEHLNLPLDYESLLQAGAMVGSGGLVVLSDKTCMVELARFFMSFAQKESCGKCVLCREGTKRMLEILERIVAGQGCPGDLDLLEEIGNAVKVGSLCGLGKTAPNSVLSTLRYFRSEYEAHVIDKVCPAGQCSKLKVYKINPELCKGCGLCSKKCPSLAISGKKGQPYVIDPDICGKCGACLGVCPFKAIEEVA